MRTTTASRYVGRFAPSPTGDLHLGTLTAAAASYLHARQANGEWLVRIEDIDPPREVAGSAESILRGLEALGFEWDREVRYQSSRLEHYEAVARDLVGSGLAYYCTCSRQQVRELTGGTRYPGTCRDRGLTASGAAIRLRVAAGIEAVEDRLQRPIERDIQASEGDFVIFRRDGLPAYHLAVVLDDADQGITDIVRGADLLDSTPLHCYLQRQLGLPRPAYWHIPLVTDHNGAKLSKGTGAAAVDIRRPSEAALRALRILGLDPPADLEGAPARTLWSYAREHWRIEALAATGP